MDGEDVQPVEEVLAQLASSHRLSGLAVGGRDHAYVDAQAVAAADPRHGGGFEHPQQPDLQLEWRLRDLVQEEGAAVGALEVALVDAVGSGEAPALVSEELALDEGGGNRTAVHGHERLPGAPTHLMHRLGHQLLARPGVSGQEDGRV